MNDFEIQRRLRDLRTPREPQHDLFPQIARRIAADMGMPVAAAPRRRGWFPLATAAALAMAISAGMFALGLQQQVQSEADAMLTPMPPVREQIERAHELAREGDPRLAGAEVVLDAASIELEQAIQQQPDAVYLVGLINRTHSQRRKLARLGVDAG